MLKLWITLLKVLTLGRTEMGIGKAFICLKLKINIIPLLYYSYEYYLITMDDLKKYGPGPAQIVAIVDGVTEKIKK